MRTENLYGDAEAAGDTRESNDPVMIVQTRIFTANSLSKCPALYTATTDPFGSFFS
jgi:hypothetical protein